MIPTPMGKSCIGDVFLEHWILAHELFAWRLYLTHILFSSAMLKPDYNSSEERRWEINYLAAASITGTPDDRLLSTKVQKTGTGK
jgi:hypothetical protein